MKNSFKAVLAIGLVLVLAVGVTGCTTTSGPAIKMEAFKVGASEYAGVSYVKLNVSITNDHAGTVRIATSNFLLDDSTGQVNMPVNPSHETVLTNGHSAVATINFPIADGSHPQTLKYFDGTNEVECTVS